MHNPLFEGNRISSGTNTSLGMRKLFEENSQCEYRSRGIKQCIVKVSADFGKSGFNEGNSGIKQVYGAGDDLELNDICDESCGADSVKSIQRDTTKKTDQFPRNKAYINDMQRKKRHFYHRSDIREAKIKRKKAYTPGTLTHPDMTNSGNNLSNCGNGDLKVRVPKKKYAVFIGYDGSSFHGFQKQNLANQSNLLEIIDSGVVFGKEKTRVFGDPQTSWAVAAENKTDEICCMRKTCKDQNQEPLRTVEAVLEHAIFQAGGFPVGCFKCFYRLQWSRAARTDKGVHASCNVVALKMNPGVEEIKLETGNESEGDIGFVSDEIPSGKNAHCNQDAFAETKNLNGDCKEKQAVCESINIGLNCGGTKSKVRNAAGTPVGDDIILGCQLDDSETVELGFVQRVNTFLPEGVRCFAIRRVGKHFDARITCSRRRYEYILPVWLLQPIAVRKDLVSMHSSYMNASTENGERSCLSGVCSGEVLSQYQTFKSSEGTGKGALEISAHGPERLVTEFYPILCAGGKSTREPCFVAKEQVNTEESIEGEERSASTVENTKVEIRSRLASRMRGEAPPVCSIMDQAHIEDFLEQPKSRLNAILQLYVGTHNFKNFTRRTAGKESSWGSFRRHITKITVKPEIMAGTNEQVAVVTIEGQSFLYNQIRKMIGLAVEICRETAPLSAMKMATSNVNTFIHTAPAEGLLLLNPVYKMYNETRSNPPTFPLIEFDSIDADIVEFKKEFIYPRIAASLRQPVWREWIQDINWHPYFLENSMTRNDITKSKI